MRQVIVRCERACLISGGPLFRAGEETVLDADVAQQLVDQGAAVILRVVKNPPADRMVRQATTKHAGVS